MKSFEIMKVLYLKFGEERTLMVKGKTAISILNKEIAGEISVKKVIGGTLLSRILV